MRSDGSGEDFSGPDGLALESNARELPHRREVDLPILYKGRKLHTHYRTDFICFDSIIVELKAVSELSGAHQAQVINYLKATGYEVGLLVNFGTESLQYKRLVLSRRNLRQSAKSADGSKSTDCADYAERS